MPKQELWLVRHGETEWSRTGQHTGSADIGLTELGERQALALKSALAGEEFARVLVSPLRRARQTCDLAGFGAVAAVTPDLAEWNYGRYEGQTSAEIQRERPGWSIWGEGPEGGETIAQVGERAARVLEGLDALEGQAALFAHGHVLRILTAVWLGLPPNGARLFALSTGSISVLGYEHGTRVIRSWNQVPE
ncbi:MAG: histidine phosphatase family protein [Bryobacteraceae bacterium]|nr:histidine phosphatase family protein [Bryobacteraceae bacterium]